MEEQRLYLLAAPDAVESFKFIEAALNTYLVTHIYIIEFPGIASILELIYLV